MKIILTYIPPLNSFILNETECEGLPEGAQVTVKTRCQGTGIAPTGIIIDVPGSKSLDEMAALLDEANLKIAAFEEQIGELEAASVELEAEIEELNKKLALDADTTTPPYESEAPAAEKATKKAGKK
jgi:hypothetical protein